ncbi:hypothetical protein GCM10023197_09150 [Gordonia humi]
MVAVNWPEWMLYRPPGTEESQFKAGRRNAVQDVVGQVLRAAMGISVAGPPEGVYWRGQGDISWRLDSTATRAGMSPDDIADHEAAAIAHASVACR